MKKEKGKIITITSSKGGVGKTILSVIIAGIYSDLGKKVLLVDMDLYNGGISLITDLEPTRNIYNFFDDCKNNRYRDHREYILKYNENIDILAAPKDPRQARKIDGNYISTILSTVKSKYDIVLVDTTHLLNTTNIMTIDQSDVILFILSNDPNSVRNSKSFMSIMKDAGRSNIRVLLNNSVDPEKNYFSLYDMKHIMGHNIDYSVSKHCFSKQIDKYVMNGTLLQNKTLFKDRKKLEKMCLALLEVEGD